MKKSIIYSKVVCIFVKQNNHKTQIEMTNSQVIKANGFKTKRIESDLKGVFGGNCNHVIALLNANDEVLCYDGKPYFPAGRDNAFASLIKSGDINAECFTFKSLN